MHGAGRLLGSLGQDDWRSRKDHGRGRRLDELAMMLRCGVLSRRDIEARSLFSGLIIGITPASKVAGARALLQVYVAVRHETKVHLPPNPERKGGEGQDDDAESEMADSVPHGEMKIKEWKSGSQVT